MWLVAFDTWHMTDDMWHMTPDTQGLMNIVLKCQVSSPYVLGVNVFFEDSEQKDDLPNQ